MSLDYIKALFFSLLLVMPAKAASQADISVTGYVIDSATGKGVPFAAVIADSYRNATTTDGGGLFRLTIQKRNDITITVRSVGYRVKEYALPAAYNGDTLKIYLEEDLIGMDEVVVTATRSNRTLSDVPVLTHTINVAQINRTASTSVTDVISSYYSFAEFYNEGRGMTFRTQGLSTKYTLFLIDGERIAGENRDNIDYCRLNADMIERIEIIPGASSSLYGSNAIGSVINLITRDPVKPLEVNLTSSFSDYNQFENSIGVGANRGKLNFYANALMRTARGYDNTPVETPDLYTVEPFRLYSLFSRARYDLSETADIEARLSLFSRERFNAVSHIPVHPLYTDIAGGLRGNIELTDKLRTTLSLYHDTYRSYDILERLDNKRRKTYRNSQTTGKILLFGSLDGTGGTSHSLTGGAELFYDNMFAERIYGSTRSNTISSLFIQDEIDTDFGLSVVAGARADFNSRFGNALSPKVSAMYNMGSFNFRTSYAQGYRAPGIKERFYDFDISFVTVYGNENLVPEESEYIAVSAEYLSSRSNLSINLYRNNILNMIHEVKLEDVFNGYTYENFLNVLVRGFDINVRSHISSLHITASYSYTDALDTETGSQLVGVSRHVGNFMADHTHRWEKVAATLALSAKMYGKKEFINIDYNSGEMFEDLYPAYSIWRMTGSVMLFNNALTISTGIDNLFNYRAISDLICTDPGRRPFIRISASIDNLYNQLKL